MRDLWFRSGTSDVVAPNLLGGRATTLLDTTSLVRVGAGLSDGTASGLSICFDLQLDVIDHECGKRRHPLLLQDWIVEPPPSPFLGLLEYPLRRIDGDCELLLSRTHRSRGPRFACHLYEAIQG